VETDSTPPLIKIFFYPAVKLGGIPSPKVTRDQVLTVLELLEGITAS
jgi:hypothetical protein